MVTAIRGRRCILCNTRWPQHPGGLCQSCWRDLGNTESRNAVLRERGIAKAEQAEALKKEDTETMNRFRAATRNGEQCIIVWDGTCGSLDYVVNGRLGVEPC